MTDKIYDLEFITENGHVLHRVWLTFQATFTIHVANTLLKIRMNEGMDPTWECSPRNQVVLSHTFSWTSNLNIQRHFTRVWNFCTNNLYVVTTKIFPFVLIFTFWHPISWSHYATKRSTKNLGSIPRRSRDVCLHTCVQTASVSHPASYPTNFRVLSRNSV
jgi:hypothetical protein